MIVRYYKAAGIVVTHNRNHIGVSLMEAMQSILMNWTKNRCLSLLMAIVLLTAMTACAKSSIKEEASGAGSSSQISEAGSSGQVEEAQTPMESSAEQAQSIDETSAEQAQSIDESSAEQAQSIDETSAEQGQSIDETAEEQGPSAEEALQILQQADEEAQEKYNNLDLNDKASVIEMVQALEQMHSAIQLARNRQAAAWDAEGKTLSIGQEIRCVCVYTGGSPTFISYMEGREGLVITHYGGDDYRILYVCDGILIGRESGHSSGRLDFSGCLPDWKDDPSGETHSIIDGREVTDDFNGLNYDEEAEQMGKWLQEAEEVLDQQ